MNNLSSNNNINICNIIFSKNCIKIYPDYNKCNILDIYIILYSYIKSNLSVRKIVLIYEDNIVMYYNISYIINFDYVEFKIWWYKLENYLLFEEDSKIINYIEKKDFYFEINYFNKFDELYPIYPWSNEIIDNVKPKIHTI